MQRPSFIEVPGFGVENEKINRAWGRTWYKPYRCRCLFDNFPLREMLNRVIRLVKRIFLECVSRTVSYELR